MRRSFRSAASASDPKTNFQAKRPPLLLNPALGAVAWQESISGKKTLRRAVLRTWRETPLDPTTADQTWRGRLTPSLISRRANAQDDQTCGGISEAGGGTAEAAFLRLAGARLAAAFLAAVFFAAVFLAPPFLAALFFTAPFRAVFFATALRAVFFAATFFAGLFFAADFLAVFLTAAFAICSVPHVSPALRAISRAVQEHDQTYIRFESMQEFDTLKTVARQDDYRIIARARASIRWLQTRRAAEQNTDQDRSPMLSTELALTLARRRRPPGLALNPALLQGFDLCEI
jgi:hypothetical protein